MKDRKKCYSSRDAFFTCIDEFKDKPDDQVSKCERLKGEFETACPPSWVHHFVLQRVVLHVDQNNTGFPPNT